MTDAPPDAPGIAPVYRDDPRLEPLIGPGGPFEVEARRARRRPAPGVRPRAAHDRRRVRHGRRARGAGPPRPRRRAADLRATCARRSLSLARELQSTFGVRPGDRVAIAMRNLPEFVVVVLGRGARRCHRRAVELVVDGRRARLRAPRRRRVGRVRSTTSGVERVVADGRPEGVRPRGRADRRAGATRRSTSWSRGTPFDDDADRAARSRRPGDDPLHVGHDRAAEGRARSPTGPRSPTSGTWRSAPARESHHLRTTTRPAPSAGHARRPRPLFHIGGVAADHREPDGRLEDRDHAQVGRRRRPAARPTRSSITGFGGVPADRPPDPRAPRRRASSASTSARSRWVVPRCRPTSRCARSRSSATDVQILNGYGLTETTSAVVTNVGVEFAAHPDSVGRPNLTADVRVVDADGHALGVGEVGELCFRSPQVVQGLLERRGGDGGVVRRRLVPLGRRRLRRRRRLRVRGRPA